MPELPEVETIRRQSQEYLVGRTIKSVSQNDHGVLRGDVPSLGKKRFLGVRRFGKLLVFDLSGEISLAVHLKMTGRLTFLATDQKEPSHTHVMFVLSDG